MGSEMCIRDSDNMSEQLGQQIATAIRMTIVDEKRPGGLLA